jgi:hypothetical protein
MGVVGGVEQAVTVPPHPYQAGHPQLGQVLGHRRRLGADVIGQVPDRVLTVQECPEDSEPGVVSQQLERVDRQPELRVIRITN